MGSGIGIFSSLESTNDHFHPKIQVERQVDVNLVGTMRVTKLCLPLLKVNLQKLIIKNCDDDDNVSQRRGGRVLNVSSVAGLYAYPGANDLIG